MDPLLDLSHAAPNIIAMVLGSMPLRDRFICALVCKTWAEAAIASTHSIILKHRTQDLSGLQLWMKKHGSRLEVLQLHACCKAAKLTALPCGAQLQDLLFHGTSSQCVSIASRTWGDIASATKLTSISLSYVQTTSQQADVAAALTALPKLEQLTWHFVFCSGEQQPCDSLLLQQMTRLTSLDLEGLTAAALQHLGCLTKLQHLRISVAPGWAAAGCPGLQKLKALTSLVLARKALADLPASASQLTALRQLDVWRATPTALNQLQVLTGLTQLCVQQVTGLSPESPPLKLPGLQHLTLQDEYVEEDEEEEDYVYKTMPVSFLASCTQLQFLKVRSYGLTGPGSLVASTMLQHLELHNCSISAADGAAEAASWQQVLPGPGQLPHLTSLQLFDEQPALQQADVEALVACCNNLKVLISDRLPSSCAPGLARLPSLTHLQLYYANDEECSAMAQLTGLRHLQVAFPFEVSAMGLRPLTALQHLTSLAISDFNCVKLSILADILVKDSLPGCPIALVNKAPSGSPPDVSSRLLDICDVADACAGLKIEAVIEAAEKELKPSECSGYQAGRFNTWTNKPLTVEALLAGAAALKA